VIAVALTLIGLGIADIARGTPQQPAPPWRAAAAALAAPVVAYALAEGSGMTTSEALTITLWVTFVVAIWVLFDVEGVPAPKPIVPLVWLLVALAAAVLGSGIAGPVQGRIGEWYLDLPFQVAQDTRSDTFLLACGAVLVLTATGNRVVRLVLAAAGTLTTSAPAPLKGGRILGPMERLIIFAVLLAGQPTAAAIIITAKGLLRLPEVRSDREQSAGRSDDVGEYLLLGTFASLMLGAAAALLVAAAG
jgi:hypothetical protein